MTDRQASGDILRAPLIIEYPFKRTTGPVIGAFLTGLRERVLVGSRAVDGRVIVPPAEFDPVTGEDLTELVEVGPGGVISTWAWVTQPHEKHPLDQPFAWALITLDGADTPMLGAVAGASRVKARPIPAASAPSPAATSMRWNGRAANCSAQFAKIAVSRRANTKPILASR